MNCIIQTNALSFAYNNGKKVLNQISLHVPKGAIYGFLGPNGAGKSTTMILLTGIVPQQGDAIRIFGKPLQQQLPYLFARVGSLVEQPALYLHLSGINNLRYMAAATALKQGRKSSRFQGSGSCRKCHVVGQFNRPVCAY